MVLMRRNPYIAIVLCFSLLGLTLASNASVICRCKGDCKALQKAVERSCGNHKPVVPPCCKARQAAAGNNQGRPVTASCCAVPESRTQCASQLPSKTVHPACTHCQKLPGGPVLAVSAHSTLSVAACSLVPSAYEGIVCVPEPGAGRSFSHDAPALGGGCWSVLAKTCTLLI